MATTFDWKYVSDLIEKIKNRLKTQKALSIFTVLSTFLIGRYFYCKISNKYIKKLPPGPIGLPFFGISFGKLVPYLRNKYYRSEILHATYGSNIIYYVLGRTPYVTIQSPDIARYVLSDKNSNNRPKPAPGAGGVSIDAFVNINGKKWILRRRLAQSNLIRMSTSSTMNKIIYKFLSESVFPILDSKINKNKGIWDKPRELMSYLTFDTIFYLNFGRTINMNDPFNKELTDLIDRGARVDSSLLNFLPFLRNISYFTNSYDGLRQKRYELYSKLINQRKIEYYNDNKDKPQSYIDYLLKEENKSMTETEIQSDLALMFNAGQDTTASSLEFCFSYLCKYINIQNMIRNELQQCFGGKDNNMNLNNIDIMSKYNQLNYLKAFIHEILRISSIVPVGVLRYAGNDIFIPKEIINDNNNNEYIIPKGCSIVYLSEKMNHTKYNNSSWIQFDDNVELKNWLDKNDKFSKNEEQFFVFGYGRRHCVGKELAKKEILITLGYLLLKYKLKFANKIYQSDPENVKIKKAETRGVVIMKPSIPIQLSYV